MKKRGLDSPDRGDAAALSVYLGKIKKYTKCSESGEYRWPWKEQLLEKQIGGCLNGYL